MYILAIVKIADSQQIIAFNKSFVLQYSINKKNKSYSGILLQIISKLIFSMSNVNIIVDTIIIFA